MALLGHVEASSMRKLAEELKRQFCESIDRAFPPEERPVQSSGIGQAQEEQFERRQQYQEPERTDPRKRHSSGAGGHSRRDHHSLRDRERIKGNGRSRDYEDEDRYDIHISSGEGRRSDRALPDRTRTGWNMFSTGNH